MLTEDEKVKEYKYIREQIQKNLLVVFRNLIFMPSRHDYIKMSYSGSLSELKKVCKRIVTLIEYQEKINKDDLL